MIGQLACAGIMAGTLSLLRYKIKHGAKDRRNVDPLWQILLYGYF